MEPSRHTNVVNPLSVQVETDLGGGMDLADMYGTPDSTVQECSTFNSTEQDNTDHDVHSIKPGLERCDDLIDPDPDSSPDPDPDPNPNLEPDLDSDQDPFLNPNPSTEIDPDPDPIIDSNPDRTSPETDPSSDRKYKCEVNSELEAASSSEIECYSEPEIEHDYKPDHEHESEPDHEHYHEPNHESDHESIHMSKPDQRSNSEIKPTEDEIKSEPEDDENKPLLEIKTEPSPEIKPGTDPGEGGGKVQVQGELRRQFAPVEGVLRSVPEHSLLTQMEPLNQSSSTPPAEIKENDAASETYTESTTNTAVSSKTGGYRTQFTKTEPLTARQQVALWLTRTSTQDVNQEFTSLRSLVLPSAPKKSKMTTKNKEIRRNFSTRSLMDRLTPSKDPHYTYAPIRKCETVLALSEGRDPHYTTGFEMFDPTTSACRNHTTQKKRASNGSLLFKRLSKTGSDIFRGPATCGGRSEVVSMETQGSGIVAVRPVNRLRSQTSLLQCSRCTSVLSVYSRAHSQMSLLSDRKNFKNPAADDVMCKICLVDYPVSFMVKLEGCGCLFCKECMYQYITFEVMEGAYDISCPDQECPTQGVMNPHQMERLTSRELLDKHRNFRLNTEVSMDSERTFCPSAGCDTICHICTGNKSQCVAVNCPTCSKEFCSLCSSTWHPGLSCAENGALLVARGTSGHEEALCWNDTIKKCPMCHVPIERDAGCAQMMCKRCKHVFCWYCLSSLDDDFLLRHYDSGNCRGKLGHSRASVLWHRAQVIGIFAGFGILLLVASPLLLVAAPCVLCCKCRSCSKSESGTPKSDSIVYSS
jgi:E3 ubiquitin-protein ligase RNF144